MTCKVSCQIQHQENMICMEVIIGTILSSLVISRDRGYACMIIVHIVRRRKIIVAFIS